MWLRMTNHAGLMKTFSIEATAEMKKNSIGLGFPPILFCLSSILDVSAVGQSVPPAVESKCTTFEGENGSI
jgi:hypothetical protein